MIDPRRPAAAAAAAPAPSDRPAPAPGEPPAASAGPGARPTGAAAPTDRSCDYRTVCPNCSAVLFDRGCKTRCPRCHFFTDCSDPW